MASDRSTSEARGIAMMISVGASAAAIAARWRAGGGCAVWRCETASAGEAAYPSLEDGRRRDHRDHCRELERREQRRGVEVGALYGVAPDLGLDGGLPWSAEQQDDSERGEAEQE